MVGVGELPVKGKTVEKGPRKGFRGAPGRAGGDRWGLGVLASQVL